MEPEPPMTVDMPEPEVTDVLNRLDQVLEQLDRILAAMEEKTDQEETEAP